ncbi:MAG: molybdopterin-binding protein [Alkalilacustris sp.]
MGRDSIWLGLATPGGAVTAENLPTRAAAEARLQALVAEALERGERLLIGADFAFGYPAGFAARLTGRAEALAVWDWLAARLRDGPDNANNRFEVAAEANRAFPGLGPFWFRPARTDLPDLPLRGNDRTFRDLPELREVDGRAPGAQSVWKLGGAGSVGSQSLTGLPVLWRLRAAHPGQVAVWPFEDMAGAAVVLAEVFPSLLRAEIAGQPSDPDTVLDERQVRTLATALARLAATDGLGPLLDAADGPALAEEGWVLGVGQEAALRAAVDDLTPPRLRDDCFAMPQGVAWVPVDAALERLRAALHPVAGTETLPTARAAGRILAAACTARRSNPPAPNAAVDGYGFAHAATGAGVQRLPLLAGRAAAGQPHQGAVPTGSALRILTGAILPEGVDTVVLEEDTASDGARIAFDGPVKPRANTRRAGEDVTAGTTILHPGHRLRPPDLALLTALGVAGVTVHRPLRVAVLSTGDELLDDPGAPAQPHQIYDANRPMLLALARGWGHAAVDLDVAPDDPAEIARRLDRGAAEADVILTSGGASAGDEDHVSRLLRERGTLSSWRIALKPGRPLALALWRGVPVFGLPGNPVAALVCALIFARPALSLLAGGGWAEPQGFSVPAAFAKRKKPGRREYLRARLTPEGHAEVFASEGSGRISGLVWATGLVELPDGAAEVTPGTPVRFLPYSGFGL